MKSIPTLAASVALLATLPAFAAPTTITFEGVTSFASVADFYSGGSDGAGASGTNMGVSFSGAAMALSNDALQTYFSNAPSPGTVMFATDASAVMTVAQGFSGDIAFWYSAASSALDVVTIYSGTAGSGAQLGSVSLSRNAQTGGCSDTAFCNWQRVSLSFNGTARSVGFGGNFGNVAFDNVTISAVPEAPSAALLAMGAAGLLLTARRRQRRG